LYSTDIERSPLTEKHNLGIAVQIPKGHVGLLFPRSSCAKTGKWMGNSVGVIDSDYIGELSAVFYTRDGADEYHVGDRVAQLIIMPIPEIEWHEVQELSPTERGSGGYGSTGR
jgi:dUTP pyrophosphatase